MAPSGLTGRRIAGRYELREQLGEGGMGIIWQAEDLVLGRQVAIKEIELPPAVSDKQRAFLRARVSREARAAARLNHPGAVIVFAVTSENGQDYIIMELVDAPTLSEVVREHGPLAPAEVAELGLGVLATLNAAHEAGIVHRDVKPSNVMVRRDGTTKLADFGVASLRGDPKLTATGMVMGSPPYMAPEQVKGEESGAPADLWALGATLYFAVEGVPPYGPGPQFQVLDAVIHKPPRHGKRLGPLTPVISALLDKDPTRRPAPDDLRAMLRQVAAGRPAPGPAPAGPVSASAAPAPPLKAKDRQGERPQQDRQQADEPAETVNGRAPRQAVTPSTLVGAWVDPPSTSSSYASRLRRGPIVALLVLLGLILAGLIGWRLGHSGSSASAASQRHGRPSASAPAFSVPSSWVSWTSPDRTWQVSHPPSWTTVRHKSGLIDFVAPNSDRLFRVGVDQDQADPLTAQRQIEANLIAEPSTRDYRRISLNLIAYQHTRAAAWEFTYTGNGMPWHGLDVIFVEGGHRYAILFRATAGRWSAAASERSGFLAAFKPLP